MSLLTGSATGLQTDGATRFTFRDHHHSTRIIFYPNRPGPISHAEPHTGPKLDYKGVEGTFTFFSDRIEIQDSPIGSLITVPLENSIDSGALTFTLALPPVNMAGAEKQTFDAVGIKTKSFGLLRRDGAMLIDTAICLQAVAEDVRLPMLQPESGLQMSETVSMLAKAIIQELKEYKDAEIAAANNKIVALETKDECLESENANLTAELARLKIENSKLTTTGSKVRGLEKAGYNR